MTRKVELANDLGPQEGNYVRANGELEAGKDLFCHSRSAEHVTALEHEDLLARAREGGGIHQTVVATTNNDDVVAIIHLLEVCCLLKIR